MFLKLFTVVPSYFFSNVAAPITLLTNFHKLLAISDWLFQYMLPNLQFHKVLVLSNMSSVLGSEYKLKTYSFIIFETFLSQKYIESFTWE